VFESTDIIDIQNKTNLLNNSVTLKIEETYNEDFNGFNSLTEEDHKIKKTYKELIKSADNSFDFMLSEGDEVVKTPTKKLEPTKPPQNSYDDSNRVATRSRSYRHEHSIPLQRSRSVNVKGCRK
jgi:hypothetical protein